MSERRPSASMHVADDATFEIEDLPEWMDRRFPVLFVALGGVAAAAIIREAPGPWAVVALVLVGASVSPWALSLIGIRLPDPFFAAVVIAPIGFLIVFGEHLELVDLDQGGPQLVMMLLIGIAGQIGTVGTTRLVRNTTAATFGVVIAGGFTRGDPLDYVPWLVGIVLGVGGGRAFRANVVHLAELRAAQHALAQQAVSDERRRIAREVHDIVAHTMSVTMLHLTAARMAIQRDPAAAEAALAEAERHGRASMDDIRSVVRLLRSDETSVDAALPDETDLPELVERYRTAGSDVRLHADGVTESLGPTIRLAVYRVVQESLSNAVRHGRDPITVSVSRTVDAVEIEVTNPNAAPVPPDPATGSGIAGMRERIEALDGTFTAGPVAGDRTWRVHARIPT